MPSETRAILTAHDERAALDAGYRADLTAVEGEVFERWQDGFRWQKYQRGGNAGAVSDYAAYREEWDALESAIAAFTERLRARCQEFIMDREGD